MKEIFSISFVMVHLNQMLFVHDVKMLMQLPKLGLNNLFQIKYQLRYFKKLKYILIFDINDINAIPNS